MSTSFTTGSFFRAAFAVVLTLTLGCENAEVEFDRKRSPLGEVDLIVTVAEPILPHGKHKVSVYIAAINKPSQKLIATTLENDGVPFTKKNIGLRWTSATQALVCLRPTDLADRGVYVTMGTPATAELRTGC